MFAIYYYFSMPTYVIIEKRDFESLFETVESNGTEITAINVKAAHSSKKRSGVPLHRPRGKKDKQKDQSCATCSSRAPSSNKSQSGTTKCIGTFSRTVDPSTGKTIVAGEQSDSESDTKPEAKFTGRVCRSEGVEYTSTSSSE